MLLVTFTWLYLGYFALFGQYQKWMLFLVSLLRNKLISVASNKTMLWKGCRSMRYYSPRHLHFVYVIDIYILQYYDDNSRHLPSYEFST